MLAARASNKATTARVETSIRPLLASSFPSTTSFPCSSSPAHHLPYHKAPLMHPRRLRAGWIRQHGFSTSSSLNTYRPTLYTMGEGYLGSLGQGDFEPKPYLTPVATLAPYQILDFASGWDHSAVVTTCGQLFLFGRPHDVRKALSLRHMWQTFPFLVRINQAMKGIFDSPAADASTYLREDVLLLPRAFPLPPGETPLKVACSGALTAVITESGRVFCMGHNAYGQCGVGGAVLVAAVEEEGGREGGRQAPKGQKMQKADVANVWTPMTPVQGLEKEGEDGEMPSCKSIKDPVVEVALGFQHALCCTRGGRAYAWGKGERGQLGNGAVVNHNSAFPIDLPVGTKVKRVASGFNHAAALTEEGKVWVWGKWQGLGMRSEGGRGVDLYEDQLLPREVEMPGEEGGAEVVVVDVACGHFHTSLLVKAEEGGKNRWRLYMFGMRAGVRTVEPVPTPVPLPEEDGEEEGGWRFGKGGTMVHTVVERVGGRGGVYKAEFEGEDTRFVPVCSEEQLRGGNDEALSGNQIEGHGAAVEASTSRKKVLKYTEGLVHRLALVEDVKDVTQ
ncbi:hypothetical protein VYU27_008094 [Nannochloropsis oceanica]